jgi:hypothetical protein
MLLTLMIFGWNSISAVGLKGRPQREQRVFDIAEKLKSAVKKKKRCWRLNREELRRKDEAEQEWNCGKEWVRVDLIQYDSEAKAGETYREQRDQIVQAPGRVIDTYHFGDESRVTAYSPYSTSSYVFFRIGKIFVRIDSNLTRKGKTETTLKNATLFAQLLVNEMK